MVSNDERFTDDFHNPMDPSAPSLSLDSARSEYRRMIDYVCGLFLQAAVSRLLLLLRLPYLNLSLLQRLLPLILIGLTVCALLSWMPIVVWLPS